MDRNLKIVAINDDQVTVPIIITVVGDSLALPRQFQGMYFYQTYPYLLAQWLRDQGCRAEVWQSSGAGAPVTQLLKRYNDYHTYVGRHRQSIGIVHLGVVDCSPRPIPLWLRRIIGTLPECMRSPIIKILHNYRVQLLRYGPRFVFTEPKKFEYTYRRLLTQMQEDFSQIYAVNILPPGEYFESRSPGVGKKIEEYNRIIAKVVQSMERVGLLSIWNACQEPNALSKYVSGHDGHHLSVEGHRRIFEMLIDGPIAEVVVNEKPFAQRS